MTRKPIVLLAAAVALVAPAAACVAPASPPQATTPTR